MRRRAGPQARGLRRGQGWIEPLRCSCRPGAAAAVPAVIPGIAASGNRRDSISGNREPGPCLVLRRSEGLVAKGGPRFGRIRRLSLAPPLA